MEVKFCDGCRHLNPPENHPHTTLHWCLMTDKQVYHHGFHPLIKRPDWCPISIELDTIAALRAEVALCETTHANLNDEYHVLKKKMEEKDRDINHLWQRDSVWRAKKEMLENDLAKAWERLAEKERECEELAGCLREIAKTKSEPIYAVDHQDKTPSRMAKRKLEELYGKDSDTVRIRL